VILKEEVSFTAKGHGYYRVLVEGEEVSKHTAEREALESATNHYEDGLDVRVIHDYEVQVVKNTQGNIVKVRVKTQKLKLNTPMAIVSYTSPGIGQTNPDSVPAAFFFTTQTGVEIATTVTSNWITVEDTTIPSTISISGANNPEYQIEGEVAWRQAAYTVAPGKRVRVRHEASAFNGQSIVTTLNIGGVMGTFTSTTVSDSSYLLFDNFDSGSYSGPQNGIEIFNEAFAPVGSETSQSGAYAVRCRHDFGHRAKRNLEVGLDLNGHYPEIWLQYDLYIHPNYSHESALSGTSNNKGFLTAFERDIAGGQSRSAAYIDSQGMILGNTFWPSSGGQSYLSCMAWGAIGIDTHNVEDINQFNTINYGNCIASDSFGEWLTITCHYKLASSANNDGVIEVWIYNQGTQVSTKIVDVQTGNWYYKRGTSTPVSQLGWTDLRLLGYVNSNPLGDDSNIGHLYIDNVKFNGATPIDIPG
jgi:hypothetical protein